MLLISISSHVPYSIFKTLHTKDSSQAQYRRGKNQLTHSQCQANKRGGKKTRERERELCNRKKSKNKHTPF